MGGKKIVTNSESSAPVKNSPAPAADNLLSEKYKEYAVDGSEWYFFTTRERRYPNGVQPRRNAGNHEGHWKPLGVSEPIMDKHGRIFGSKRILDYHMFNEAALTKASTRTDFKMVEYVVVDAEIAAFTDFCLCKIYKNHRKSPGNSDSLTDGDDTHPSAEANISSTLRADRYSGSSLPQHISNNASNLDGSRKRRLNSSLPPPNHNYHVQTYQEMPFVNPFPWFGNNLTVAEENALFEMELREENQTNTYFNELPDMDQNDPDFWDFDGQHLLTDQQCSLIRCDRINAPVAAHHQQQPQEQWHLQQQTQQQWRPQQQTQRTMASAAADTTTMVSAAAATAAIASASNLRSRGNSTSSSANSLR
ncbi:NAC domain-containing protein 74-like [Papaver somniferum]|uniref:NAC domain-containing protein 74-like n=1 Tax=Papaver somniferum TaxID=3469 RepID=UPI000E7035AA|nr:NAC domain-containing protein 74-like [Papaver somniferum]